MTGSGRGPGAQDPLDQGVDVHVVRAGDSRPAFSDCGRLRATIDRLVGAAVGQHRQRDIAGVPSEQGPQDQLIATGEQQSGDRQESGAETRGGLCRKGITSERSPGTTNSLKCPVARRAIRCGSVVRRDRDVVDVARRGFLVAGQDRASSARHVAHSQVPQGGFLQAGTTGGSVAAPSRVAEGAHLLGTVDVNPMMGTCRFPRDCW